ncbi:hypothetical protein [Sphaerothrix gracilis]|uniref:hypothetical protein n=1 Tax=Sphaerothrix gracilis TaxID=3151835 RepID=UPI0031FC69E0
MPDETTPQEPQPVSAASPPESAQPSAAEIEDDKLSSEETALKSTEGLAATSAPEATSKKSRWQQAKTLWQGFLALVRSRLPASWQPRLSDGILSAILLGAAALLLTFIASLLTPEPVLPPSQPLVVLPSEVPEVTVVEPEPVLPPEQERIAEIQDQVAEITQQYAEGLVQSVQADFRQSELAVKLGPAWYQLSRDRQDQVANGILAAVQPLAFDRLWLTDDAGKHLARNPVVGNNMVILQRQSQPEEGE